MRRDGIDPPLARERPTSKSLNFGTETALAAILDVCEEFELAVPKVRIGYANLNF